MGRCENPLQTNDWIDHLLGEIPIYNAANPDSPATIGDVARAVKQRLVQSSALSEGSPSTGASNEIVVATLPIPPTDGDDYFDWNAGEPPHPTGPGNPNTIAESIPPIDPIDPTGPSGEAGTAPLPETPDSEVDGIELLFGASLETEASEEEVSDLEGKTRRFC